MKIGVHYNKSSFSKRQFLLITEVCSMGVEFGQVSMNRGCGTELHVRTEVVSPNLTVLTGATGNTWLNGYPVTYNPKRMASDSIHMNRLLYFIS